MLCTLCTKRGIPCIHTSTATNPCDSFQQAHKKFVFVGKPFQPRGQRISCLRRPPEDPFVFDNDESIPEQEWTPRPQAGRQERFRTISPVPSSIDLCIPLLGHHQMVTSLLNWSKVIIQPMKDGNSKRTFEVGPIVTMSCHPWHSNTKRKTHQIPHNKTLLFLVCLARKLCDKSLQAQVAPDEPSQHNEPPITGPSQASDSQLPSHENNLTCEPETEVAPTQSSEEPFACPATPCSSIIINDRPIGTSLPPLPSSPSTHPSTPLIPTIRLCRDSPTYNQR
ncbi:hypothetical protein O181_043149 [Austropuccinia psidii MF-1]|uniref:Uncharacterized protein n=1 Tax=Austropuccinia psidii MF-1 TaxID=1389203 RepID=A0A9Q3DHG1_9BASI|nr:hypothetical protein [Austropuccinia psidii MF-1]